ncbi:MAG: cell division protein ZipA C-terminal FtsZ-binding domain-containing protein [Candidatus Sedimenticola endophacoides]
MDADVLRLTLFLAGIGLILGIYCWDRQRKLGTKIHAIRRAQESIEHEINTSRSLQEQADKAEKDTGHPLGVLAEDPFARGRGPGAPEEEPELDLDEELERLDETVSEPFSADPPSTGTEGGGQTAFSFSAAEREEWDDQSAQQLPGKILQLNVVTRDERMEVADIYRAAHEVGLRYGDMQIFHRHLDGADSPVIFSMASLVEPGIFPALPGDGFSTPGLTLFARLPGPLDGLQVFSDMLMSAERLAAELNGSLQDATHSDLTRQTIEHVREEILEHRRQVHLAKIKSK